MVKPIAFKHRQKPMAIARMAGASLTFFMTDALRLSDPSSVIERLPIGSIVVIRDYGHPQRALLAKEVALLARQKGCLVFVAGDLTLSRQVGAHGFHAPEHMLSNRVVLHRARSMGLLVSAACHNRAALKKAEEAAVDYVFVSPAFSTGSHPGAPTLGVHKLARLTTGIKAQKVALGGINNSTAGRLRGLGFVGVAGITGVV